MNLKRAFVLVTMSVVTFWSLIPFALSVRALIFAELVLIKTLHVGALPGATGAKKCNFTNFIYSQT